MERPDATRYGADCLLVRQTGKKPPAIYSGHNVIFG